MSKHQLDYQPPPTEPDRDSTISIKLFVTCAVVLNGLLLAWVASDRRWAAIPVAIMIGPIANGLLLVISLAFIPVVKRISSAEVLLLHVLLSVAGCFGAVVFDLFIIFFVMH